MSSFFKIVFLLFVPLLLSCKLGNTKESFVTTAKYALANEGKIIFEGKGNCISCHLKDKKGIGPSIIKIAEIYEMKGSNIVPFLKGESDPIVDPSQYEIMKTNFAITKMFTDQDLEAISDYMLSELK